MIAWISKIFKSNIDLDEVLVTAENFADYQNALIHSWLRTLFILGATLVPVFFLLDFITIPEEHISLLPRFGLYRALSTLLIVIQFIVITKTKPNHFNYLHGYLFNVAVSLAIVLMTVHLGGFESSYYAGLNLVVIAVNLLLPWKAIHSFFNGFLTIALYVGFNAFSDQNIDPKVLINNLYFMSSTVIIASSINHVKYILIQKDFDSRRSLKAARDSLWSEMEVATQIQTALVPPNFRNAGYEIATKMIPADQVGGDYCDIIHNGDETWVMIGDVSGHGVESGLIMMMTQTSIRTILTENPNIKPSELLIYLNKVIIENIALLKVDRYLTLTAIHLRKDEIVYAGSHQDLIVKRDGKDKLETYPTVGTWIGMLDDVSVYMQDRTLPINKGDTILLFTDGITEIGFGEKDMYGQWRLEESFIKNAHLSLTELIDKMIADALDHKTVQEDDISLLVFRKL
jgi:phosphoserine phosphatase RsbU/P